MTGAETGFVVLGIDRTGDGRDIVLRRTFAGDRVSVGRGEDNEVRVPDLAVPLRHVIIRRASPSRLIVQASPAHPFEVDGRRMSRVEIDPAGENMIRLGRHAILIRRDEDSMIAIAVTGPVEVSSAASGSGAETAFDLGWVLPERRIVAAVLAILMFLVCALLAGYAG